MNTRQMGRSQYGWIDGTLVHNVLIDERRGMERMKGTERKDIDSSI